MTINNLLYVDDDSDWLEMGQRKFESITPNVDVAENYSSALKMVRQTRYDLIVLDSLESNCFILYQNLQDIPHGEVILFSTDSRIQGKAESLGIPFYNKGQGFDDLVDAYKE